ncbi:MAG: DUF6119 family protein [Streptosporangiaceae bacterium]
MPKPTREATVYRLAGVDPDLDGLLGVLNDSWLDQREFDLQEAAFPGAIALSVHGYLRIGKAGWVDDAARLIGDVHDYESRDSGALLLIALAGHVYAIGFGDGFRLVPDADKDQTFGLQFAIRAVDAEEVREVVRRTMGGISRQDSTYAPKGIPIGRIGLSEYTELVRRLAGRVDGRELGLDRSERVSVEGAAGLRLRIPLDNAELIDLLQRISDICTRDVQPEFAFVDAIRPVRDRAVGQRLDGLLGQALRGEIDLPLGAVVPVELTSELHRARSYRIRIGTIALPPRRDLDLADILRRCRLQQRIPAVHALRTGRVEMCSDAAGTVVIGEASALRWLEATAIIDGRRHFLIEGNWYEAGVEYFASIARQITELFPAEPSIMLPTWKNGVHEREYNLSVQHDLGRASFLSLDRTGIKTALHKFNGFEPCDLFGPEGELIHVKPADGSGPLSHLFNQALVSTEALFLRPEAAAQFAALIQERSAGTRSVPADYRPKKIIFAIMLKTGRTLTPDSLFPFAQIALANMARTLKHRYGVDIEVIGIPRTR